MLAAPHGRKALAAHIMLYLLADSLGTSTWVYRAIVDERPGGGHFAGMEQPALFADDIGAFMGGCG